jgi:hypothetical protein
MRKSNKLTESFNQIGISRLTTNRSNETKKEETMSSKIKSTLIVFVALFAAFAIAGSAMAATNQATDGGGSITLTASGNVTITIPATATRLVKQVYIGGTCMASSIAAGADSCNGGATSIVVSAGTAVEFLIFVRNETDVQVSDVRFVDDIDDILASGFTYAGGDLITTTPIGSLELDNATAADIYTDASTGATAQTDAVNVGGEHYVSVTDGGDQANLDYVTVGAVVGQVNTTLNIPLRTTFGVLIPVTKN